MTSRGWHQHDPPAISWPAVRRLIWFANAGTGTTWQQGDANYDGAVNGLARLWELLGERLRPLQTGRVQNYAFSIFAGMLVLVVVLAWVWGS